jgi:hypothetical protein
MQMGIKFSFLYCKERLEQFKKGFSMIWYLSEDLPTVQKRRIENKDYCK